MAVVLLLTTLNNPTIEFPLLGKCTLGRSSSCDLTVDDRQMSGKHGVFEINSMGQLFYSDLGSTNGSYLNNSTIHKVQFRLNEVLKLGNTLIIIDEKRLSTKERIAIGVSLQKADKRMEVPILKVTKSIVSSSASIEEKETTNARKSVVLNKNLKKKAPNWMSGKKESLIDQEESSGNTKVLKLDTNKVKKK